MYDRLQRIVVSGVNRYLLTRDVERDWWVYHLDGEPDDPHHSYRVKAYRGGRDEPDHFFIRMSDKAKLWLLPGGEGVELEEEEEGPGEGIEQGTPKQAPLQDPAGAGWLPQGLATPALSCSDTTDQRDATPQHRHHHRDSTPEQFPEVQQQQQQQRRQDTPLERLCTDDALPPHTETSATLPPDTTAEVRAKAGETFASFRDFLRRVPFPALSIPPRGEVVPQYLNIFRSLVGRDVSGPEEVAIQDELVMNMVEVHAALSSLNDATIQAQSRVMSQATPQAIHSPIQNAVGRSFGAIAEFEAEEEALMQREDEILQGCSSQLARLGSAAAGRALEARLASEVRALRQEHRGQLEAFRAEEEAIRSGCNASFATLAVQRRELARRRAELDAQARETGREAEQRLAQADTAIRHSRAVLEANSPERLEAELATHVEAHRAQIEDARRSQDACMRQQLDEMALGGGGGGGGSAVFDTLEADVCSLERTGLAMGRQVAEAAAAAAEARSAVEIGEARAQEVRASADRETKEEVERLRSQAESYIRATQAAFSRSVGEIVRRAKGLGGGGGGDSATQPGNFSQGQRNGSSSGGGLPPPSLWTQATAATLSSSSVGGGGGGGGSASAAPCSTSSVGGGGGGVAPAATASAAATQPRRRQSPQPPQQPTAPAGYRGGAGEEECGDAGGFCVVPHTPLGGGGGGGARDARSSVSRAASSEPQPTPASTSFPAHLPRSVGGGATAAAAADPPVFVSSSSAADHHHHHPATAAPHHPAATPPPPPAAPMLTPVVGVPASPAPSHSAAAVQAVPVVYAVGVQTDAPQEAASVAPPAVQDCAGAGNPWGEAALQQFEAREQALREDELRVQQLHREAIRAADSAERFEHEQRLKDRDHSESSARLDLARQQVALLEERDADSQHLLRELTRRCDEHDYQTQDLLSERDDLEARCIRLTREYDESLQELQALRAHNTRLADDLDSSRELAARELRQSEKSTDSRVGEAAREAVLLEERYKGEVEALRAEVAEASARAAESERAAAKAQAAIQAEQTAAAIAERRAAQLEDEARQLRDVHRSDKASLESDYARRGAELKDSAAECGRLRQHAASLQQEVARLKAAQVRPPGHAEAERALVREREEALRVAQSLQEELGVLRAQAVRQEGRMLLEMDRLRSRAQGGVGVGVGVGGADQHSPFARTPSRSPILHPGNSASRARSRSVDSAAAAQLPLPLAPPPGYARSRSRSPSVHDLI